MRIHEHHLFARDLNRDYPLAVKGQGCWVWDEQGKKYLDACAGANVTAIGHGVTSVADAMAEQAKTIAYAPPQHFLNRPSVELAERLLEMAPPGYSRVMLLSGGSEAIENAVKIARQYHVYSGNESKYRVVSRWQGFHGNTLGADSISGKTDRRTIQTPMLMNVPHIVPACCYRCAYSMEYPKCGMLCAKDLERLVVQEGPQYVAAFVSETIVGAAGAAVTPVPEYYPMIRKVCDEHNILWIADEIMCGMGRTGTFAAIEHWNVLPDMLVLAKGLSSGYAPLAAILLRDNVFQAFGDSKLPFIGGHTYNCHPVTAAVGLSAIDYLEKNRLMDDVPQKGKLLSDGLVAIAERSPLVGNVRGKGLMWGVEIVADKQTKRPFALERHAAFRISMLAMQNGLLVYPVAGCADGRQGDGLLICPPLVISNEEIKVFLELLEKTLADFAAEL